MRKRGSRAWGGSGGLGQAGRGVGLRRGLGIRSNGQGGGPGIGEANGALVHVVPAFVLVLEVVFLLEGGEGGKHEVADVGESGGVATGNAILGQCGEEFAEDEVDVGGGHEVAGEGAGNLGAEAMRFEKLLLVAGVEETERGVRGGAKHAAAASVGGLKGAAIDGEGGRWHGRFLIVFFGGVFPGHFHGKTSK
jgi:hypothetical protein